ncbi:DUF2069 domain-containing protein [Pararobbsia alpina]|uniref:DUF2069 domain-containing protein n=1 Tax=Pararobbsia alpina TaxID=621374 RepID=A0A6S7BB55_9BURK|nr:DUF2069 domain-containing protein [Pararobbsia alpina]CAB3794373.1 hypothetical protein LMG28138_03681 [Pararobbsia alpina]
MTPNPTNTLASFTLYRTARMALIVLIVLCFAWEAWLAPLRPGGSLLVLKIVPLLLPLYGVMRRSLYTLQWSSMLVLAYFTEGVVRGWSDPAPIASLAWSEAALSLIYFVCAIWYVKPFKQEAKRRAALEQEAETDQ